jgi:hypothetical protein
LIHEVGADEQGGGEEGERAQEPPEGVRIAPVKFGGDEAYAAARGEVRGDQGVVDPLAFEGVDPHALGLVEESRRGFEFALAGEEAQAGGGVAARLGNGHVEAKIIGERMRAQLRGEQRGESVGLDVQRQRQGRIMGLMLVQKFAEGQGAGTRGIVRDHQAAVTVAQIGLGAVTGGEGARECGRRIVLGGAEPPTAMTENAHGNQAARRVRRAGDGARRRCRAARAAACRRSGSSAAGSVDSTRDGGTESNGEHMPPPFAKNGPPRADGFQRINHERLRS